MFGVKHTRGHFGPDISSQHTHLQNCSHVPVSFLPGLAEGDKRGHVRFIVLISSVLFLGSAVLLSTLNSQECVRSISPSL